MKALAKITMLSLMLASFMVAGVGNVAADDNAPAKRVTFYKDVLPILQESCQACHREQGLNFGGMVAPMALITYQQVRPWAKSIATQVSAKSMPPWHATPATHGVFINERTIREDQIATLVSWVQSGATRGNPNDAPTPLEFPDSEWGFEPDLVVSMPEPYFVGDDVQDLYINFKTTITEEMLPKERWVQMSESKPGSTAVHHIIARPIGGQAPGGGHTVYPDGYGVLLKPGTEVTFQMHYHKESGPGTGVWDQSKVALRFHTKPVTHPITTTAIGNMTFEVPPRHPNWEVGASMKFKKDTTLLRFMPHMHLRGKDAKYTAFYPDGTSEVLLDVPEYDFNWQTSYRYKERKEIPAGTRIEVMMHFDNSPENAARVNFNADRPVSFGGPTTDEMMLGWMTFADKEATIVADESTQ